ncbi:MAG: FAD-linked oxidase C-terminal domain-containing protein, partial [Alphaproteobacteria bacterium]
FNLLPPRGGDKSAFQGEMARMNRVVHDLVVDMGGSISAEHGIGRLRRDELHHYKSPVAIALMRAQPREPRHLLEGEAHLGDGRGVGHHTIFPGLSRLRGSSVALSARIIAIATGDL